MLPHTKAARNKWKVGSVAAAKPSTADGVGGGNAGEYGEASRHIEVLVTVTLVQHCGGDV